MPTRTGIQNVKRFVYCIFLVALIIVFLLLVLFRFQPQVLLPIANSISPYQIHSTALETKLWPLSIQSKGLLVKHHPNTGAAATLVKADYFYARLQLWDYLSERHNYWYAELKDAEISIANIERLPPSPNETTPESNDEIELSFNPHRLVSAINCNLTNTKLTLENGSYLLIKQLSTELSKLDSLDAKDLKQNIQIALQYGHSAEMLNLKGQITSQFSRGASNIHLALEELDLTDVIASSKTDDKETTVAPGNRAMQTGEPELQTIDWTWLAKLENTLVDLKIAEVMLDQNLVEELSLQLRLNRLIEIERLTGDVVWEVSESLRLQDSIELTAKVEPILNSTSVSAVINGKSSSSSINVTGEIDLYTPLSSSISIATSIEGIPLTGDGEAVAEMNRTVASWLPLSTRFKIQTLGGDANASESNSGEHLAVKNIDVKAGASDISGEINLFGLSTQNSEPAGMPKIVAQLSSNLIDLRNEEQTSSDDNKEPGTGESVSNSNRMFSEEPIEFDALNNLNIDIVAEIKTMLLDGYELKNIQLPAKLADKKLSLPQIQATLGEGKIKAIVSIDNTTDQPSLTMSGAAEGLKLHELYPSDEGYISGGDSRFEYDLSSKGLNTQELASNLNGNVLFHVENSEIASDAFELIGSDLISELITKLNPFVRSDPTTELECGVVNLGVKDGLIDIDNSIVLETSKMLIIADGEVDLNTEEVNLEIKPQATSGIGVDVGSLVKFMELGGTLSSPKPKVGADGLLQTGVAIGAAISTGGASILADGVISKFVSGGACEKALAISQK